MTFELYGIPARIDVLHLDIMTFDWYRTPTRVNHDCNSPCLEKGITDLHYLMMEMS